MPKRIQFEGATHEFPDDFSDADIQKALATAHPQQAPESQGFLGSLWEGVKSGPANLLKVGEGINQAVAHPGLTVNAMGQQIADTGRKAVESFKGGDIKKGVRQAINTGLNVVAPGLGTSSEEAGAKFDRGDISGGLGSTAALGINTAIGLKIPEIGRGAMNAIPKYTVPKVEALSKPEPSSLSKLTLADPRVAMTRALRPIPSDPEFPVTVPESLSAIKKANAGEIPGGVTKGTLDIIPAANKAIAEHQAALDQWLTRAKGVNVSGDQIVAATRESIPKLMWTRDPQGAQALIDQAQQAFGGKRFSVADFRDFLKSENADLSGFYNKSPVAQQNAATAGTPTAIEEAQTGAIRDVLYKALDPEGNGAGPRLIQQKTGDLINMRNAAMRRNNAIVAEQPVTMFDRLLDPIKAHLPSALQSKATGLSFSEGQVGRSLPLIKKAFKTVGEPNALPLPGEPLYPTGNPQRGLPAGDIVTPSPADSSYVRGVPGMTQPLNPRLAIPGRPDIITPPPADASSVRMGGLAPHQEANRMRPALPQGRAPFTQGIQVPDIQGRPQRSTGYGIEGPAQPAIPSGQGTRIGAMSEASGGRTSPAPFYIDAQGNKVYLGSQQ